MDGLDRTSALRVILGTAATSDLATKGGPRDSMFRCVVALRALGFTDEELSGGVQWVTEQVRQGIGRFEATPEQVG